jgi:hypothetical protein
LGGGGHFFLLKEFYFLCLSYLAQKSNASRFFKINVKGYRVAFLEHNAAAAVTRPALQAASRHEANRPRIF